MGSTRAPAAHRENSNDALLGSVLAIEATLRAVVARLGDGGPAGTRDTTAADLRRAVEASLRGRPLATRYGTGEQEIADGLQDALDAIFAEAEGPRA